MEQEESLDGSANAATDGGDLVDFRHGTFYGPVLGVQHNHYEMPRPLASWPHQVGTIPPQAVCFQDRAEVARLATALADSGTAVVAQAAPAGVVVGLGGVGKTQLAAHYARTAWQAKDLDVLVWTTATTADEVRTAYARAAAELLGTASGDTTRAADVFLAWLQPKAAQKRCRWLVILDDVSDPKDMDGLWPPSSVTGRTLITTRRQDAALTAGRRLIPVGVFTPAESLAYLTGALPAHTEPADQLAALADDLGHLPLALSQAAAYLTDTGINPADYRQMLADRTTALRAPDALPDGQQLAVATTWSVSIERADGLEPAGLARPLLQLAAFLEPNGIPATVLTSPPARAYLAHHRTSSGAAAPRLVSPPGAKPQSQEEVPERDVLTALSALRRLSLIQHTPTTPRTAVRVHQLVQRAVRDTLTPEQHDHTARIAADALLTSWPEIERDTALGQALRANSDALASQAEDALYRLNAHEVLFRTGTSLGEAGQVTGAIAYWQRLLASANQHWGPDHPDTLRTRGRLLRWQAAAGDRSGAATAYAALLHDMTDVLGADHPDTLRTHGALVWWQGWAGDKSGAASASAALLKDMIRVLGPDHPDTLRTHATLAWWRGQTGDPAGAATTYAEVLAGRLRMVGPDHPDTLRTRSYLSWWHGWAGDPEGSAAASAELLQDMTRVLGPDHPDTLRTRNNLHFMQGMAGNTGEAVQGFERLLPDMARVLGTDHPDTVAAQGDLVWFQGR
ncbi:tetratricopeptide repeat protein [Streptomyces sp. NPDC059010]|uniref:tetratricopeptide repeat protein n=1 Tax=Streptomyces sp. NPDC059010 TaxID=3346695 RepID=UPI00367E1241